MRRTQTQVTFDPRQDTPPPMSNVPRCRIPVPPAVPLPSHQGQAWSSGTARVASRTTRCRINTSRSSGDQLARRRDRRPRPTAGTAMRIAALRRRLLGIERRGNFGHRPRVGSTEAFRLVGDDHTLGVDVDLVAKPAMYGAATAVMVMAGIVGDAAASGIRETPRGARGLPLTEADDPRPRRRGAAAHGAPRASSCSGTLAHDR